MTQEQLLSFALSVGWSLAGFALTAGLVRGFPYALRLLRAHVAAKQWDAITAVARDAVQAANQTIKANPEKKAYVLAAVQGFLDGHGIRLDATALDVAIESSVLSEKTWIHP